MTARRRMLWWRIVRALRVLALRLRLADAEDRERRDLDEYMADEAARSAAWRAHPFPDLDHDPEARAIAIRLHRQIAGEWIVEDRP